MKNDRDEIFRTIDTFWEEEQVIEARAFQTTRSGYRNTYSGYFDDPDILVSKVTGLDAEGIYFILNPVQEDLLARAKNRIRKGAKHTTKDEEIIWRRWMIIDFDPERPTGISSTDAEHQYALERATQVRAALHEQGWPEPVLADSGNGAHLLYRIELPPDDDDLIRNCLQALDQQFSDEEVKVDEGVYNPARLCKLYGTVVRKGDPTENRPHRRSGLLEVPENPRPVPVELLEALAGKLPQENKEQADRPPRTPGSRPTPDQIRELLDYVPPQPEYLPWIKVIAAVQDGVGEDDQLAKRLLEEWSAEITEGEYDYKLRHSLDQVGFGTLVYMAKQHGWTPGPAFREEEEGRQPPDTQQNFRANGASQDLTTEDKEEDVPAIENAPTVSDELVDQLPRLLRCGTTLYSHARERDCFLTGAVTVLSGCMPNVFGRYGPKAKRYSPHANTMILAPGGGGKGAQEDSRRYGNKVHDHLIKASEEKRDEWEQQIDALEEALDDIEESKWNSKKEVKAELARLKKHEPPIRRLFVAGNTSHRGLVDNVAANGSGIMHSSETDALTQANGREWGNWSYVVRKSFEHERIELSRKGENIEVDDPALAIGLAGTPNQFHPFVEDGIQDGLFSRFLYYCFVPDPSWHDVTPREWDVWPEEMLDELSAEVKRMYKQLEQREETLWIWPKRHQYALLNRFERLNDWGFERYGHKWLATARRMGVSAFRLIMTFSVLRAFEDEEDLASKEIIEPADMDVALGFLLAKVYAEHVKILFGQLSRLDGEISSKDKKKARMYEYLPQTFGRSELIEAAEQTGVSEATAYRYLDEWQDEGKVESGHGSHSKNLRETEKLRNSQFLSFSSPRDDHELRTLSATLEWLKKKREEFGSSNNVHQKPAGSLHAEKEGNNAGTEPSTAPETTRSDDTVILEAFANGDVIETPAGERGTVAYCEREQVIVDLENGFGRKSFDPGELKSIEEVPF